MSRGQIYWSNIEKEQHHPALSTEVPAHPSRIGLFAPPNSGKRSLALNIIAAVQASKRPFNGKIHVVTQESESDEWEVLDDHPGGFEQSSYRDDGLPSSEDFDRNVKNLLILDEISFLSMSKQDKSALERAFNFISSHRSVTIILMAQDGFSIPISVRRSLTHVCLWKSPVQTTAQAYSRMLGEPIGQLQKTFCRSRHDALCIDLSGEGELLRLNWSEPIRRV